MPGRLDIRYGVKKLVRGTSVPTIPSEARLNGEVQALQSVAVKGRVFVRLLYVARPLPKLLLPSPSFRLRDGALGTYVIRCPFCKRSKRRVLRLQARDNVKRTATVLIEFRHCSSWMNSRISSKSSGVKRLSTPPT